MKVAKQNHSARWTRVCWKRLLENVTAQPNAPHISNQYVATFLRTNVTQVWLPCFNILQDVVWCSIERGQTCITSLLRLYCYYTECLLHTNVTMHVCFIRPLQYLDFPLHLLSVIYFIRPYLCRNSQNKERSRAKGKCLSRGWHVTRSTRWKDDDKGAFENFRAKKTYLISTCVILNWRNRFILFLNQLLNTSVE